MAEAFFRQQWELEGMLPGKVQVCSAGLTAIEGLAASREALTLLRHEGSAMEHHRSRPVEADMLKNADYIFTMTATHKHFILERFPDCVKKVWTLGEYGGTESDITDPYGGGMEAYKVAASQIKKAIMGVIIRLKREASSEQSA